MPQSKREAIGSQNAEFATAQLEIDWIHTCRVNSYQSVSEARLRCRKISNPENLVPSISIDGSGNHVTFITDARPVILFSPKTSFTCCPQTSLTLPRVTRGGEGRGMDNDGCSRTARAVCG